MQDSQVGTVIADSEDDSNDIEDDFYCSSGYVSNERQKSVQDEDLGLRRLLTEEKKAWRPEHRVKCYNVPKKR